MYSCIGRGPFYLDQKEAEISSERGPFYLDHQKEAAVRYSERGPFYLDHQKEVAARVATTDAFKENSSAAIKLRYIVY